MKENNYVSLDELLADLDSWGNEENTILRKEAYQHFYDIVDRYFSSYDNDTMNTDYQELISDYEDCSDYSEFSKSLNNVFTTDKGFEIFQFSTEYITAISRGIIISNDILEIEYSITTIERY